MDKSALLMEASAQAEWMSVPITNTGRNSSVGVVLHEQGENTWHKVSLIVSVTEGRGARKRSEQCGVSGAECANECAVLSKRMGVPCGVSG